MECRWNDPLTITIPEHWVSGFYLTKLTDVQTRRQSYIIFVVRDDVRRADHLFVSAVTTYQAYNYYGGFSLYKGRRNSAGVWQGPGGKLSFDRPYDLSFYTDYHEEPFHRTPGFDPFWRNGSGDFLRGELQMVRWLEREGYDVSYATNIDAHANGRMLRRHRSLMSVGHDEYWTPQMRRHWERARRAGVDLHFFSANSVYERARLEPSRGPRRFRTLVAYKDRWPTDPFATDGVPGNDRQITGLWRQCRGTSPGRDESALVGLSFFFLGPRLVRDIVINEDARSHWALAGVSEADYVIVGAGSAGCVLAGRSSRWTGAPATRRLRWWNWGTSRTSVGPRPITSSCWRRKRRAQAARCPRAADRSARWRSTRRAARWCSPGAPSAGPRGSITCRFPSSSRSSSVPA